jgi:molybdate-binding protein
MLSHRVPGLVAAGCEPGLAIVEQTLKESCIGAMWVATSSASALTALDSGRAHLAAVHGSKRELDRLAGSRSLNRLHLANWRIGLGATKGTRTGWQSRALSVKVPVVQREDGARIQQAFKKALTTEQRMVAGPVAATHLEAAHRGLWAGIPALTFEPAARTLGLDFHPLATHVVEVWYPGEFDQDPSLVAALNLISSRRFARVLESIGGYDLANIGTRVA